MSEWKEYKLGEVCDLLDCLHKTPVYSHDGYPMVRVTDVNNGPLDTSKCLKVSEKVYRDFLKGYKPSIGDIVFSRVGSFGNSSIVKTEIDFCIGQNTTLIIPKKINPFFAFYYLTSFDARNQIDGLAGGSTQPTISMKSIREIVFPMPPLKEQTAIAEVLSSLDDKIDLLHRQNKTLEQLAETLFRQWFVEEAEESWEEKELWEFGNIICGKTPSKKIHSYFNGNIPFIKIPDMHGKAFLFETEDSLTEEGANSQKNKFIPAKSICVSCIATVGLVSMNVLPSQTNQQINSVIPLKDFYRYFLYLKMKSIKDDLLAMASGGTATDNLNTGNFSKIKFSVPNDERLEKFHLEVEPLFDKILSNTNQIKTLTQLRDTLLPKLMSGEIRVKQIL